VSEEPELVGDLLASADLENLGPARWARALSGRTTVFHGDLLCVLDFALGFALHAVASSHGGLLVIE
jgi:hypothetical protein